MAAAPQGVVELDLEGTTCAACAMRMGGRTRRQGALTNTPRAIAFIGEVSKLSTW